MPVMVVFGGEAGARAAHVRAGANVRSRSQATR